MKWLEDLTRSLAKEPDKIPKDWLTSEQAAKISGRSKETQRRMFTRGVKAGFIQSKKFKVRGKSGILMPVPHYGPKP